MQTDRIIHPLRLAETVTVNLRQVEGDGTGTKSRSSEGQLGRLK